MKNFILAVSALLVGVLGSQAAQVTYSQSYNSVADNTLILNLQQFSPSMGLLTGVTINYTVEKYWGALEVDNDIFETSFDIHHYVAAQLTSTDVMLKKADASPIEMVLVGESANIHLGATVGDNWDAFDRTEAGDYFLFEPNGSSGQSSAVIGSSYFTAGAKGYRGTGTFAMNLRLTMQAGTEDPDYFHYLVEPSLASGNVSVTYTYTVLGLPEPGTAFLTVGSLAGLLFRSRRRKR